MSAVSDHELSGAVREVRAQETALRQALLKEDPAGEPQVEGGMVADGLPEWLGGLVRRVADRLREVAERG